jgi:SAM-dependent methyltransferase
MTFDQFLDVLRAREPTRSFVQKWSSYLVEHRYRFQETLRRLPRGGRPLSVLDVGPTHLTLFLKAAFPDWEVWAMDRTDGWREYLAPAGVQFKTCDLDHQPLPFDDGRFDLVLMTEVLEHVFAPPSGVLKEVRRVLRPDGRLILSVPNIASLPNRLRLLFGVTHLEHPDQQMNKDASWGHGHLHEYTRREIAGLLTGVGFQVESQGWLGPPLADAFRNPRERLAYRLFRLGWYAAGRLVRSIRPTIVVECRRA